MIDLLDFRSIRFSEKAANGFINLQPDYYGTEGAGPALEGAFHGGIWGRPMDPDTDPDTSGQGVGANALYLSAGSNGRMMPLHDPRFFPLLPDPGKGGWGFYGQVNVGGTKMVPYARFVGEGGGMTAGSLEIKVPYSGGAKAHTLTIDLGANAITLTHGDTGVKVELGPTKVILGADAGGALVIDMGGSFTTWVANVIAALASLGRTVDPPVDFVATKVEAR